jgi:Zn-dependent protease with chaperone function
MSDTNGMTRDEFEALVRSLEAERRKRPKRFLLDTVLLVLGAYGYLLVTLALSLALLVLFVVLAVAKPNAATIKLGFASLILFGGLAFAIVKGLWIRLEPPQGLRVKRNEAPALFTFLDDLRRSVNSAPFHEVLLVPEHNASVVQIPRLGIFGWHKNYLLLGLPLLQGLAPEEFKAVLAHEFAHSSRGHGRFGNWLYRLRRSWERVVHEVARQQNDGSKVLTCFLKFFWPRFNARAFVLSRANEYEADAIARRLTSHKDAANALLRVSLNDRFLDEKFWPALYERANTEPLPPVNVFGSSAAALRFTAGQQETGKWINQAFLMETNSTDTHPSLKDRLHALGVGELTADDLPSFGVSAGDRFFGDHFASFADRLSRTWSEQVEAIWKNRHEEARHIMAEVHALEKVDDLQALWKKAAALLELNGDDAAAETIERILEIAPDHARALLLKGRRLLGKDEVSGVHLVEQAIKGDSLLTEAGCGLLHGYYIRTGQREKLRQIEDRIEAFHELEAQAQRERANVSDRDTFVPAALTDEQIAHLQEVFVKELDIASAAVVRKQVTLFPEEPAFVIALKIKFPLLSVRSAVSHQNIVNRVIEQVQLPGYFLVLVAENKVGKKIFRAEGAEIYTRKA